MVTAKSNEPVMDPAIIRVGGSGFEATVGEGLGVFGVEDDTTDDVAEIVVETLLAITDLFRRKIASRVGVGQPANGEVNTAPPVELLYVSHIPSTDETFR